MSNGPYTLTTSGEGLGPGPDRRYQFPVEFGMMKKIPPELRPFIYIAFAFLLFTLFM